jgi:hypothetical protein
VVLTTLKNLGVTPDFVVHHRYPEFTAAGNPSGSDSDSFLLQCSTAWLGDAATLRQEISDYLGSAGTNIELVCTENNSDAGAQGKQSTSLVNGIYYADSLGELMKTEFNAFVWWDLRNGTDTNGDFDTELYGWRTYGDLGVINGLNTRHPAFYASKLMSDFVTGGDQVLTAASDYPLLSAYAIRGASGQVRVLVLHKDPSTNFSAQISIQGFAPAGSGSITSYGIPQDEATRTNGPASAQDLATNSMTGISTNFTMSFAPYSMSVLNFYPAPPHLLVSAPTPDGGPLILTLQGQPGVGYLLQTSSDLLGWANVSTNTLSSGSVRIISPLSSGVHFWRAVWQP